MLKPADDVRECDEGKGQAYGIDQRMERSRFGATDRVLELWCAGHVALQKGKRSMSE